MPRMLHISCTQLCKAETYSSIREAQEAHKSIPWFVLETVAGFGGYYNFGNYIISRIHSDYVTEANPS